MNKNILCISILVTMFLVAGAIANPVAAQPEIAYPVSELGNCADKSACKTYCDQPANVDACLSFAEKNNLMSNEEIKMAKNFKKAGMTGPGGCKGKDECKTYCNGPDHMGACLSFAEKNGMMSGDQLQEAKKVQGAIAKGIKPPACGGKDACNSYCSSKEHMSECVNFAESAGIISKEEADKIKSGGPGGKGPGGPGGSGNPDGGGKGGPGDDRRGPDGPSGGGKKGPGGGPNEGQGYNPGSGKNGNGSGNGQGNSVPNGGGPSGGQGGGGNSEDGR